MTEKRVVLSSDSNSNYLFLAPITGFMWSLIGFNPHYLFITDNNQRLQTELIRFVAGEALDFNLNCRITFVEKIDGFSTASAAQVSRLFCGLLDDGEDSMLMTSDCDMVPLSSQFFNFEIDRFNVYNLEGDDDSFMCYCCAKSSVWLEFMSLQQSQSLRHALRDALLENIGYGKELWGCDENILNAKVRERSKDIAFHKRTKSTETGLPIGRICRSHWDRTVSSIKPSERIDAHLLRPGHTEDNWVRILSLLTQTNPVAAMKAIKYRNAYLDVLKRLGLQ